MNIPPLHRIPDELIPRDPRLGASSVPVPRSHLDALARTGPVLLGRPEDADVIEFRASVDAELSTLLQLPAGYSCTVVPAPWPVPGRTALPPRTRDLSGSTDALLPTTYAALDVGYFCPHQLLGVPRGTTVVVHTVPMAFSGQPVGVTDLIVLAHAVRETGNAGVEAVLTAVDQRFDLLRAWSASRSWVRAPRHRAGRLVVPLTTDLDPEPLLTVGEFLTRHHIAYDLVTAGSPVELRISVAPSVSINDLERLLGLLDFIAAWLT